MIRTMPATTTIHTHKLISGSPAAAVAEPAQSKNDENDDQDEYPQ